MDDGDGCCSVLFLCDGQSGVATRGNKRASGKQNLSYSQVLETGRALQHAEPNGKVLMQVRRQKEQEQARAWAMASIGVSRQRQGRGRVNSLGLAIANHFHRL